MTQPNVYSQTDLKTSQRMRRVGRPDTSIERQVRYVLNRLGFRCRRKNNRIVGKPDIVLIGSKTAIFVNGCFWHGHESCRKGLRRPKNNAQYWAEKIARNKSRDLRVISELKSKGWRVVTIWECGILKADFEYSLKQALLDTQKSRNQVM